ALSWPLGQLRDEWPTWPSQAGFEIRATLAISGLLSRARFLSLGRIPGVVLVPATGLSSMMMFAASRIGPMNRRCIVAIVLGGIVLAHPAAGKDSANLRGDSAQTRKRLAAAEQKMLAGKHADAADDLQRVLDEA